MDLNGYPPTGPGGRISGHARIVLRMPSTGCPDARGLVAAHPLERPSPGGGRYAHEEGRRSATPGAHDQHLPSCMFGFGSLVASRLVELTRASDAGSR